ncbi:GntR family transcriptional regulator [Paenibacillus koleovorans]|uniref:GntR family transcriptional regulator n=1 Tax=Paenibacillus koleovorans TaxID=121608 RepID=UPI000FD9FA42|nr:GntR family transcriptional regulator [Paenibacillus koleovorans]
MSEELFHRIQSDELSVKVYQRLKKAITMSVIKPGERIDMNLLSEQWGVSRTPMKDAIARLAAEGLVVVKSKIGTYATRFSADDMLELFAVRILLEAGACREVVRHVTERQLQELDQARLACEAELEKKGQAFDYFAFNEHDTRFHELLIEAAGNSKLLEVYRSLNFHTQVARYYYNRYEQKSQRTTEEHRAIVEAIRVGDAVELEAVVRRHIQSGFELVEQAKGSPG